MCTAMPDFYPNFHCIAGACQHSCCKGWEIDIDSVTLKEYQTISGPIGEKLQSNIVLKDTPHFRLDAEENCPFLNADHLCELILTLGEEHLCQICKEHPRFYNTLGDYEEVGLGLCCEEATRLLLSQKEPSAVLFHGEYPETLTAFQKGLLKRRKDILIKLQNRKKPLLFRLQEVLNENGVEFKPLPLKTLHALFLPLERMDDAWNDYIESLKTTEVKTLSCPQTFEIAFEQLTFYFVYRYFIKAFDETEIKTYLAFTAFAVYSILVLFQIQGQKGNSTMAELENIVRLFSSEIEYSDENMDVILNLLWDIQSSEKRKNNVDSDR